MLHHSSLVNVGLSKRCPEYINALTKLSVKILYKALFDFCALFNAVAEFQESSLKVHCIGLIARIRLWFHGPFVT